MSEFAESNLAAMLCNTAWSDSRYDEVFAWVNDAEFNVFDLSEYGCGEDTKQALIDLMGKLGAV